MNLIRRHGGCEITPDNPLTNLLAKKGWEKAVSKARRRREAEEERGA